MTLYRQLLTAVIVLFMLLYVVTILSMLRNSTGLLEQQMQVHAQDTANSLALSMTQAALGGEVATLDVMFNAVADRGYFYRIEFVDLEGHVLLERNFSVDLKVAPGWFVSLVSLEAPSASAEVTSGWTRLGRVNTYSYPGQAYATLWSLTVQQLIWFFCIVILVLLLAAMALRVLLRPLHRLEAQADAICNQQFPLQKNVPRTRELARVVEAMNRLSSRLKELFDHQLLQIQRLQERNFRDPVTKLSNRADFDAGMRGVISESGAGNGALMILSIANFERVNRLGSRADGNAVLYELGQRLKPLQKRYPGALLARRQGADFTVFIPGVSVEDGRELALELAELASGLSWEHQVDDPLIVHLGYTHHEHFSDPVALLREADAALRQAQLQHVSCWHEFSGEPPDLRMAHAPGEWPGLLARCLEKRQLLLEWQPMITKDHAVIGHEVYVRLQDGGEVFYPATFLPAAERYGSVPAIDRMMLETLAAAVDHEANGIIAVNLSGLSAADAAFGEWLPSFLSRHPLLAQRLVFEVPEYHLLPHGKDIVRLQQIMAPWGAGIAVDHFGRGSLAVKCLYSLPLRYLKLHRSFVRGIEHSAEQQAFVQALLQMVLVRDIPLYVEGVESAEEFSTLAGLGVTVMEGYHAGRPVPLPDSSSG